VSPPGSVLALGNSSCNLGAHILDNLNIVSLPSYAAQVQPPLNPDGTSVFNYRRGSVPVKFILTADGTSTCDLPPATISLFRTSGMSPGLINESDYTAPSDDGVDFRISGCQYIYNLDTKHLGPGSYSVRINISDAEAGSAIFGLN
jgi:hypothetical protein